MLHAFCRPHRRKQEILMCFVNTPYNRLLRRQITASTTDQGKFCGKRVGEDFLFAKINKQICGLQLMMENIFNVWRYRSSNLTLFKVQIRFCQLVQLVKTCVSRNLHKKTAFCSSRTSTKQNI